MKALVTRLLPLTVALLLCGVTRAPARQAPRGDGGVSLLLEVGAEAPQSQPGVERVAAVIRKRCSRLGINCELRPRAGGMPNRLALRFPTTPDLARARRILLAEGLEVRTVTSVPYPLPIMEYVTRAEAEGAARADEEVFPLDRRGAPETYVITKRGAIMTGDHVRGVTVFKSDEGAGQYEVDCRLSAEGSTRLEAWTRANIGRYLVVIYNGRAVSEYYVKAPVWLNVVVSGGFDRRQAEEAAVVIRSGNLPAPVRVLEEGTYRR